MNATGTITMTMRELDRFKVIQGVTDGKLKPWRAAERLVIRYREHGPGGVASGHRDRSGNRKLDDGLALRALTV